MSTSTRRIAFRSKPITRRNISTKQQQDPSAWRPSGPLRFLDLPTELRFEILKLAITQSRRHRDIVNLLLTCERVYHEAAPILYKDTTIDLSRSSATVGRLGAVLSSSSDSKVSLWRHVRNLVIKLYLVDHIHLLQNPFSDALQDMALKWNLKSLQIEIGSKFPSDDFWGNNTGIGDSEDGINDDGASSTTGSSAGALGEYRYFVTGSSKRAKGGRETEIYAPLYISTQPFQDFLRFLYLSEIAHILLSVDANDHHRFWCPFHQKTGKVRDFSSPICIGSPTGAPFVQIDWRNLIRTFGGARVPPS